MTVIGEERHGQLKVELIPPSALRVGRISTCVVKYANVGEINLPVPIFSIVSDGTVFTIGAKAYTNQVDLIGLGNYPSTGYLQPGDEHEIKVTCNIGSRTSSKVNFALKTYWIGQK